MLALCTLHSCTHADTIKALCDAQVVCPWPTLVTQVLDRHIKKINVRVLTVPELMEKLASYPPIRHVQIDVRSLASGSYTF